MKSTHWYVETDPDLWSDDPRPTPTQAAEYWLEWNDEEAWDARDDLIRIGRTVITVHGYISTNKLLEPEVAFDGYEPGDSYFEPTGEEVKVEIKRVANEVPQVVSPPLPGSPS